jgi:hypothetical protein
MGQHELPPNSELSNKVKACCHSAPKRFAAFGLLLSPPYENLEEMYEFVRSRAAWTVTQVTNGRGTQCEPCGVAIGWI